jgi:hypothetical protein
MSLYKAESAWRASDPNASKLISLSGARDLTEEVVNHPMHDSVPGIGDLRARFSARKGVKLYNSRRVDMPEHLHAGMDTEGILHFRRDRLNVGTVTHEASHLVERLGRQFLNVPEVEGHNAVFARTHARSAFGAVSPESGRNLIAAYQQHGVSVKEAR